MKKMLALTVIIISAILAVPNASNSQIIMGDVILEADYGREVSFEPFKSMLSECLRRSFYIVDQGVSNSGEILLEQNINDYFKTKIDPRFVPAVYKLTGRIKYSYPHHTDFYTISIEILDVQSNTKDFITAEGIPQEKTREVVENICGFLRNSIPSYYRIMSYNSDKTYSIDFGENNSARNGDKLELTTIEEAITIGELEVEEVHSSNSVSSIKLQYRYKDYDLKKFTQYYANTIINKRRASEYLKELLNMRTEPEEAIIERMDYFVFTFENFYFRHDEIKKYFVKERMTPYIFGAQLNLSKSDLRVFLKGRLSMESEISNTYQELPATSKFFFFMAGGGVQHKFPITGILVPGVSAGVYYVDIATTQVQNSEVAERKNFSGLSGELNANCTLKLWSLGFYGEIAYNIMPRLNSEDKSWQTSSLSLGVGMTYYFE